jgi:phenylacetate-CoA ligase
MSVIDSDQGTADALHIMESTPEEIRRYQDVQLASALNAAWSQVGFYRDLWVRRGNSADQPPADFGQWPAWNVSDLRDAMEAHPPFGNLYTAGGLADVRFIHSSSGTTGKPRYAAFTAIDQEHVFRAYGRIGRMIGLSASDVFCETGGYGVPIGAWSYTRMAQSIGAAVVPAGSGRITPSEKLIEIIHDVGVTAVEGAPSYLLHVGRKAEASGRSLGDSSVRLLSLGGESAAPSVRAELQRLWGAERVSQIYANSDVSWIAGECAVSSASGGANGMHILEDVVRVEVLDADGVPCEDGTYGELVLTSWLRPSTPRIRFRTGDRAAIDRSPCACGLTSARLLPLAGRTDDAIRYHGVTVWPLAVENILIDLTGVRREFYLQLVKHPSTGEKQLVVVVETLDGEQHLDAEQVAAGLRERLNVRIDVTVAAPGETAAVTGLGHLAKTRRFIDLYTS